MAVRLSKVIRELNVGISTAVEFLQKKGLGTVEADSNTKISDEQYDALVKEFGKDDALRGKPVKPMAREAQKKTKEEKPETSGRHNSALPCSRNCGVCYAVERKCDFCLL